jgi:hypothetical protein
MRQVKQITRSVFTKEEDLVLCNFVEQYGKDWKLISSLMINRNSRQVRDRYHYYLDPSIAKNPWTREEDFRLIELVGKYVRSWKKISESFEGRNEINVKNRWNYSLSKHYPENKRVAQENSILFNEQDNDQIISKFNIQEINYAKYPCLIGTENMKSNNHSLPLLEKNAHKSNLPLVHEKIFQKESFRAFHFYRDEDIEFSLFSIEPVQLSDFTEYL